MPAGSDFKDCAHWLSNPEPGRGTPDAQNPTWVSDIEHVVAEQFGGNADVARAWYCTRWAGGLDLARKLYMDEVA